MKKKKINVVFQKTKLKESIRFLLNSFFTFDNNILQQTVGIPMGSDPAPFFANLFLHMYESDWVQNMCRNRLPTVRRCGNIQ